MHCKFKCSLNYLLLDSDIWEKARHRYDITEDLYLESFSRSSSYYVTNSNIQVQHTNKLFTVMLNSTYITEAKVDDYIVWDDSFNYIDVYDKENFHEIFEEL